ncbi:Retron-type RNA-directed DNA polymerase [hydrothermal vent metagenome]|uniref:Retron-type RNA-directed DNA polymerase n=1 Tax=hydrothermal vent metagenome TaxID=652676 RepID=A0A3B1AU63_9ZZZZ
MKDTQKSLLISTDLRQIAEQAKEDPAKVFIALAHRMDINFLKEAYRQVRKDGAPGISGATAKDYKKNLTTNLENLHEQLKGKQYVAPMIKRVWIEKEGGKKRPIGITEFEDKIVQKAVSMLLGAVYEQDFYDFSHGFREGHSAHQALKELRDLCMNNNIQWLIDADISGFFDNINHEKLRGILRKRVNDGGIMRLIGKWLNAGVAEGEVVSYNEKGTPQGGTISPVLANIYLHQVLDEWFIKEVKPRLKGRCFIVRFADDFIIGCEHEEDARRVMEVLPKRFDRYDLTIHPEKTKMIAFGRPARKDDSKGEATFDFLGFTHYWAKSLKGNWVIKRKTARKKVRRAIVAMREWCRVNRHRSLEWQHRILSSKLRGHFQYFGIRCNMRAMESVWHFVTRGWRYWLSRRSHKSKISWEKFKKLLDLFPLPEPKIVHNV